MPRSLRRSMVLAAAALVLAGCAATGPAAGGLPVDRPGISARGVGVVTGAPDLATVVLAVQTTNPSARAALDANNVASAALADVLKGGGVAATDLQTSGLSINPTYGPTGRITGYEVTNQVTATIRDIGSAGRLIDAAAAAAGDGIRVQRLGFAIDDDSTLRAQARAEAVRLAQAQAAQLAEAAGVRLGPILSITEVPMSAPGPQYRQFPQADAPAVPVEPGTQDLSVAVEIVYGIDQ